MDILDLNSLHFRFSMYAKKGDELCQNAPLILHDLKLVLDVAECKILAG